MNDQYDCIVIGAGITGLVAARNLMKREVKVLLVEATDRIGGRIFDDQEFLFAHKDSKDSQKHGEEEKGNTTSNLEKFHIPYGANKFYPLNSEYLMNEIKKYQLEIKEEHFTKTFVQTTDFHIITLYEMFQKIQDNYYYLEIIKELNDLSILIDPVHAPFDYEKTDEFYNTYDYLSYKSSSIPSSGSFQCQQEYYKLFKKNILQSDLFHQYDIFFMNYLQNNKIFSKIIPKTFFPELTELTRPASPITMTNPSRPNSPSRKKKRERIQLLEKNYEELCKQQRNMIPFIIEFFLLCSEIIFEIDSTEISLLMLLNLINHFHFKFENLLAFYFHSYSTIDNHYNGDSSNNTSGLSKLIECIFHEFIDCGGQYLLNTPCISIYQNSHYYQASLNNFFHGTENIYNKQEVPYPRTRPTTTLTATNLTRPSTTTAPLNMNNVASIPPSTAALGGLRGGEIITRQQTRQLSTRPTSQLQPKQIKTQFPITNTFLELPPDDVHIICKLANGEIYQCKQIILTIPLHCISSIQFFPGLSSTFTHAVNRCVPNDSTNFLQCFALCSNSAREFKPNEQVLKNKSNISNRINRILAFNSGNSVKHDHFIYQSTVHHRQVVLAEDKDNPNPPDYTLVSIHGMRRAVLEDKQRSFKLMHPDIEELSKHSIFYQDFVLNPYIRSHFFHLRCGTRNLYSRLCVEAISPWKYIKQNPEFEENPSFFTTFADEDEEIARQENPGFSNYPVIKDDEMSLFITNADLSPHWTGWVEGGIYMGTKAAEILYQRIIKQPISTNFAKKKDSIIYY
jgi:hypothetical protein